MKRKNASLLGNVLMGMGLVVMVVGVGYSILNQLPQLDLPQIFAHGAILSIFVGAVLWLAGVSISHKSWCTNCCTQRAWPVFKSSATTDEEYFSSAGLRYMPNWSGVRLPIGK